MKEVTTMALIKVNQEVLRIVVTLLLIVIVLFLLAGLVGALVRKIMKAQGEKADALVINVMRAGNIPSEKAMQKFGIRKNWRVFVKEAWIPFVIMLGSSLILILYCAIHNRWGFNIWDIEKYGFSTLFFNFDWNNTPTTQWFGLTIVSGWPPLVENYGTPHFSIEAWGAYIFVPGMIVGGTWFCVCVQAYIARAIRLRKIIKKHFHPTVDDIEHKIPTTPINPE